MFAEVTDDPLGDFDDADEDLYEERRKKVQRLQQSTAAAASQAAEAGGDIAEPAEEDVVFDGGFKLSNTIYNKLFDSRRLVRCSEGPLSPLSPSCSTQHFLQVAAPAMLPATERTETSPSFWPEFNCRGGRRCNCLQLHPVQQHAQDAV